jgi:fluoroquinolone transport system permease protein
VSVRAALRTDLTVQFRYGFHAAYLFVAVMYIGLLLLVPAAPRRLAIAPVLLSEATVIGFIFAGTLLHLERSDGVLRALAVTPLRVRSYLASKVLSLVLLTAAVALAIAWAVGARVHAPLLALGAALTAALFTVAGLSAAAFFSSLDRFTVWGGLGASLLALPVLPYLGVLESPLWWLLPTWPALLLLGAGVGAPGSAAGGGAALIAAAAAMTVWVVAGFLLATRWLERRAFGRRAAGTGT